MKDYSLIIAAIRDHPFTNALVTRLWVQVDVSPSTTRLRLHKEGIRHRVPAVKEKLTAEHRDGRLKFAE